MDRHDGLWLLHLFIITFPDILLAFPGSQELAEAPIKTFTQLLEAPVERGLPKLKSNLALEVIMYQNAGELWPPGNSTFIHAMDRLHVANCQFAMAQTALKGERDAAGIPEELWHEWENFCHSLKEHDRLLDWGAPSAWTVPCSDHGGSYVNHDPDLNLFLATVRTPLEVYNFRSEPLTREHQVFDIERGVQVMIPYYSMIFTPVSAPTLVAVGQTTWGQRFVSLDIVYTNYPLNILLTASSLGPPLPTCRHGRRVWLTSSGGHARRPTRPRGFF